VLEIRKIELERVETIIDETDEICFKMFLPQNASSIL
jgi:hypothetical protein